MRVREFLSYRAKLKDVPRSKRRAAIDYVLGRCGLMEHEGRIVGQLSKGFRQRVGLADALVNDPDLLILDEPTAGLDPIQIREVRALIRELGDRHTVLLSTHIMSEVEAVCGRVIIIARGRIAEDAAVESGQNDGTIELETNGPAEVVLASLRSAPGVVSATLTERDGEFAAYAVQPRDGADLRAALGRRVFEHGWTLRRLDLRRRTLEDRFIQAVARADSAPETLEAADHGSKDV
jgi:ABC-2 type transport system ATP-binding protein